MLRVRQLIPPLTARTADGRTVQAWDFKQKKSLVIAFLHARCAPCEGWSGWLAREAADLAERDAVALVVLPEMIQSGGHSPIIMAADVTGRSQRAFLGEESGAKVRPPALGVFVTDRYGELHAQWLAEREDALPGIREVLSWLAQIQVACEECGAPHWND